ncbi:MAG: hypothetical protein WBC78_04005, partial [Candidatus Sulfotelmatobacter sp.]
MAIAAEKKEEKVEKRRALGRGLESLLPGPRVVTPVQSDGDGGETKVPHSVRDDKNVGVRDHSSVGVELGAVQPGQAVPT